MLDLWSQMFCIDMGATLGQYVTHYRAKYFNQTGFGGYEWKLKPGAAEAIQEVLAPRVKTLMDKDLLELPPLVETTIMITLPDKAMRIYKQMEDTLRLDFSAGRVTAANAAVASGKCRQLASGNTYGEDGVTVHHVHDAKLDALEQLISELQGAPALVAYAYRHEADAIKKRLGDIPTIGGGVSASETAGIIEKWNRGEIPVLLGQPQSMAHGLNLQGAGQAVIWYGLTWSLENYEQTVARVYRQGQTKHVYVYHLVSEGTVDEAVLSALRVKDTAQSGLMRALSDYWKNI
jgi:SNF2 family DNA or RNA helicase